MDSIQVYSFWYFYFTKVEKQVANGPKNFVIHAKY